MKTVKEKTTRKEQELARISVARLQQTADQLRKSPLDYARIKFTEKEDYIHIPKKAMKILFRVVKEMADGNEVSLVTMDATLSTEEAASILHVSRPFVVKLLESGAIPFSKTGTHRRILRSDLEIYRQKMNSNRNQQLEKLSKLDQDLDLGYDE